jgi:3,4-dihydroxy 2-butanone 4-phosphate synthase/GTP cyclohydrolase II
MKLDDYLNSKSITRAAFAEKVGVSGGLVTQWCDGSTWPGRENAQRIIEATGGEVTPNDFLQAAE